MKIESLGEHYRPEEGFDHGAWTQIADIPAESDGLPCKVYETRMPARFFKLVVGTGLDFRGRPRGGVTISTGSGDEMGEFIGKLAVLVAEGMIGFD